MSSSGFSLGNAVGGGIDVQSTVSQLMTLQRQPEDQLKSQQSTLNAQVSAIQTINSALSGLQTKVQAITDFNGQLSAQTTTSSNTSLLSATSDGTATLANHQIVISNLAQTSSYFTNTLASSTTKIPHGSFNISVGGTKTATITIDSTNDTLQGLASAINNTTGAGVTAHVITDTKGARLSLLSSTSGAAGEIALTRAPDLTFAAVANSDPSTVKSPSFAAGTTFSGSLTLQVGAGTPATFTVDPANNTVSGIADGINAAGLGVTASVLTDANGNQSLSLVSGTSGTAGAITVSANSVTTAVPQLTFTEAQQGKDASLKVDGIDLKTSSNQVTGVLQGLTLNLTGADPNTTVSLGVAPDANQSAAAINSFVTAYNSAIQQVNAQFVYDPVTKFSQPLQGDSSLTIVQQQLYSAISYSTPGQNNGIDSLSSLGITVNNDGTLTVDSSKLNAALAAQPADVQNFFQATSTGFAQKFNSTLTDMTDPTKGGLQVELTSINTTLSSLQSQINDFEDRMITVQQNLLDEYSQINATMQQMPMLLAQINSQLGSL